MTIFPLAVFRTHEHTRVVNSVRRKGYINAASRDAAMAVRRGKRKQAKQAGGMFAVVAVIMMGVWTSRGEVVMVEDDGGALHINTSDPTTERVFVNGVDVGRMFEMVEDEVGRVAQLEQANTALRAEQAALLERQASLESTLHGLADAHLELVQQHTTLAERFASLIDINRNALHSPISHTAMELSFASQFGSNATTSVLDMAVTDGGSVFTCGRFLGRFAAIDAGVDPSRSFLARLSSVDGRILWAIIPGPEVVRRVAADRSGRVFTSSYSRDSDTVRAYREWDGAALWETIISDPFIPTALTALRDEATLVVAASAPSSAPLNHTNILLAFDTASGAQRWSTTPVGPNEFISSVQPTPDGDAIVYAVFKSSAPTMDRRLYRIRGDDGAVMWSSTLLPAGTAPDMLAIGPADRGCVGGIMNKGTPAQEFIVQCFDLEGGNLLSPPIIVTGTFDPLGLTVIESGDVFVAARADAVFDGMPARGGSDVIAFRLSGSAVVWSDRLGGADSERPVAINTDASGNVYVTGVGQVSLDPSSGKGDGFLVKYTNAPPPPPLT